MGMGRAEGGWQCHFCSNSIWLDEMIIHIHCLYFVLSLAHIRVFCWMFLCRDLGIELCSAAVTEGSCGTELVKFSLQDMN